MKSAIRLMTSVMGVGMGLAGVEHGIGEILQGNVAPDGVMIRSWQNSAFFQSLNGEPAMTLLPNLLLTGILAVLFSLAFVGWNVFFAHHRFNGVGMMLLSIPMLLFGGGIFPPILGFLIGAVSALEVRQRSVSGLNQWLGRGWKWVFAACCAAWLALFPGVAVLGYFLGIDEVAVILAIMAAAFILLPLAFWSGLQHDRLAMS